MPARYVFAAADDPCVHALPEPAEHPLAAFVAVYLRPGPNRFTAFGARMRQKLDFRFLDDDTDVTVYVRHVTADVCVAWEVPAGVDISQDVSEGDIADTLLAAGCRRVGRVMAWDAAAEMLARQTAEANRRFRADEATAAEY